MKLLLAFSLLSFSYLGFGQQTLDLDSKQIHPVEVSMDRYEPQSSIQECGNPDEVSATMTVTRERIVIIQKHHQVCSPFSGSRSGRDVYSSDFIRNMARR